MKPIFNIIVLLLIFVATACNDIVKSSQRPGIYKANFPTKGVYIYIFKNGTCKFQDSLNQKIDIQTATWKLKGSTINITMDDTKGVWPADIENVKGVIRIVYAQEEGDYFNKIKNL